MKKLAGLFLFVLLNGYCYSCLGQITNTESFDNLFRPSGWTGGISHGSYDWAQFTTNAHSGAGGAYFDSYDAKAGDSATLISPSFSLACRSGAMTISFWMWRDNTYAALDFIDVYMNTAATQTGATKLFTTGGYGRIYRPSGTAPVVASGNWYQYTYNIPAAFNTATNYIIFSAVSAYGTYMFIDDISWSSFPCSGGPANDLCTGAITATCGNTYTGSTATATSTGDPTAYCGVTPGAAGVFYKFAGNGQNITASLCASSYDTRLNVYSGSCGSYTCITGDDDGCGGTQSTVTFPSSTGTTYYLLINGNAGATGNYSLTLTCVAPGVSNDNCTSPIAIPITATCAAPTAGTSSGGTADISGCSGNADDDVWYSFVATATTHQITIVPSATYDAVIELFSGSCAALTSLGCQDVNPAGGTEVLNASGLTIGNTYLFRVYHYGTGSGGNTFTICITPPPTPPGNDACTGATSLTVNSSCVNSAGTSVNATSSATGCSGTSNADVWYSFVAVNTSATVTVAPSSTMDAVFELYSGSCAALTEIKCEDVNATGSSETYSASGLVVGNTYYVRVYDYLGNQETFNICVYGPPAAVIPSNDDPCNAIALPDVTAACNFEQFTTLHSTQTGVGLAPTPTACVGGSGGSAGYSGASHPGDVWFSVVCPSSGQMTITSEPYGQIQGAGGIEDASMALYSGTCGALTQIACSSDNSGYPNGNASSTGGSAANFNQFLPYINATGLVAGNTYYIRYWPFSNANAGPFGLCVQTTTNDDCANALYICDLNGYSASTSAAFTADRPGSGATEMAGDAELCCWTYHSGTNEHGVFGQVDANGDVNTINGGQEQGVGLFDVTIDNNSWIRFTASSTKVVLNVTVGICFINAPYPAGGIQMQVFSASNCTNFVPVSAFLESTSGFTLTMTGLTAGSDYLLMVDGFNGDVCNYTISANSGVSFGNIAPGSNPMCVGDNDNLTAPAGATAYYWPQTGETTQVITVQPASTTTYTCVVTGNCGEKQTLTTTITVSSACAPLPVELLNFKAFYDGEAAKLIWETSSETNNNFFTVERSEDGSTFGPVGTVNTKATGGNSNSPIHYLLRDPTVKSGTYYYRVKQTDLNGNSRYSEPASLEINGGKSLFSVQPNPTRGLADLSYSSEQAEQDVLKVYDDQGHLVYSKEVSTVQGHNTVPVDLGSNLPGVYHVTMVVNQRLFGVRLIKEKQ